VNVLYLPQNHGRTETSFKGQMGLLTYYRMILAFFIPVLGFGATYVVYTYLTPILEDILHIPDQSGSAALWSGFDI
jgi:MFS transporter, DHA1 family, inner membrane transport protein